MDGDVHRRSPMVVREKLGTKNNKLRLSSVSICFYRRAVRDKTANTYIVEIAL